MESITLKRNIRNEIKKNKYALITAEEFSIAPQLVDHRNNLWADWDQLKPDRYLQDEARFRLRRFGLFYFMPDTGELLPLPPTHYFQTAGINAYAGGIERQFAPLLEATKANPFLHALIKFNFRQFPVEGDRVQQTWEIDIHQFRIVGTQDEQGEPTPEGMHHDGDDFNVIHLIRRHNATGGVNSICDNDRKLLTSRTLRQPMDSVLVWDPYVMHGVTPIHPENSGEPAIRDVLVIGYNYRPDLKKPCE